MNLNFSEKVRSSDLPHASCRQFSGDDHKLVTKQALEWVWDNLHQTIFNVQFDWHEEGLTVLVWYEGGNKRVDNPRGEW